MSIIIISLFHFCKKYIYIRAETITIFCLPITLFLNDRLTDYKLYINTEGRILTNGALKPKTGKKKKKGKKIERDEITPEVKIETLAVITVAIQGGGIGMGREGVGNNGQIIK